MERLELKKILRKNKIKQYQLAKQLGYCESRLCVILRQPISKELEAEIRKALEVLQNDK